jgi:hypothetical protein
MPTLHWGIRHTRPDFARRKKNRVAPLHHEFYRIQITAEFSNKRKKKCLLQRSSETESHAEAGGRCS